MSKFTEEMTEVFIDKNDREIMIETEEGGAETYFVAVHGGNEVGRLSVHIDEENVSFAHEIDVDAGYRRAGIGLRLVQRASEYFDAKLVPPGRFDTLKRNGNFMTEMGRSLMIAAQRGGWATKFPGDEPDA